MSLCQTTQLQNKSVSSSASTLLSTGFCLALVSLVSQGKELGKCNLGNEKRFRWQEKKVNAGAQMESFSHQSFPDGFNRSKDWSQKDIVVSGTMTVILVHYYRSASDVITLSAVTTTTTSTTTQRGSFYCTLQRRLHI